MRVTIATDSFKGSLSSIAAGEGIEAGIRRVYPEAQVDIRPAADGGEGTIEALVEGMNGTVYEELVTGPLGTPVLAKYGIIEESQTAILEMAQSSGLTLVPEEKRNPMNTTTFGVGELIKHAIDKGCRRFIVGIGGSATNDGGIGMLQALGYHLLDESGMEVSYGAKGLGDLFTIDDSKALAELKECTFRIACDVNNPLCGERGASAIYGPQKGADEDMVQQMDQWLYNYGKLTNEKYPSADMTYPGAGAAGGLGFAFLSYLNGKLEPGIQIVLEETKLEEYIKQSDYVITGEGKMDGQTVMGKVPTGVSKLAKKHGKTVLAFAGSVTRDAVLSNEEGIDAFFPILRKISTLEEAMDSQNAKENLEDTVYQVFRLIKEVGSKN